MPEPAVLDRTLSKPDQTVLLLETVDAEQPAAVQLALVPGVLPGEGHFREKVLVTLLALEILPAGQRGTRDCAGDCPEDQGNNNYRVEHFL